MSESRVAVAVIHGMGSQGTERPKQNEIKFSSGLYSHVKREFGAADFDSRVAWREIFWADILQKRQDGYIDRALAGKARWMKTRRFVMHSLTDAAAYRFIDSPDADTYGLIHGRVADTIRHLGNDVAGTDVPLIVLAHSLGGHVMSNYIYDMQCNKPVVAAANGFEKLETMCAFVTFGCNIPIFTFAWKENTITPIKRPGARIPAGKQLTPWWYNYNDKDDALGMPLADINDHYRALETSGELDDVWINSGNLMTFWNPASHNGYWTDRDFYMPVTRLIKKALKIGPVP